MTIHYFSANITFNIFSLSKGNHLSGLTTRQNKKNCSIFIIHDTNVHDVEDKSGILKRSEGILFPLVL